MDFEVIVTPSAERRLKNAVAYINDTICAPEAARRLLLGFGFATGGLKQNPTFMPVDRWASRHFKRTIYKLSIGNYIASYFADEDTSTVWVFSFLYKKQDKKRHLIRDFEESVDET